MLSQKNLLGISLYPEMKGYDFVEFYFMVNARPSQGNKSRGVDNPEIRSRNLVSDIV